MHLHPRHVEILVRFFFSVTFCLYNLTTNSYLSSFLLTSLLNPCRPGRSPSPCLFIWFHYWIGNHMICFSTARKSSVSPTPFRTYPLLLGTKWYIVARVDHRRQSTGSPKVFHKPFNLPLLFRHRHLHLFSSRFYLSLAYYSIVSAPTKTVFIYILIFTERISTCKSCSPTQPN
jgi:hypothetical protein